MNCQRCGNEVQPEELFCGQCGTATLSSPLPTSRVNSVSLGSQDLSNKNAPSPVQRAGTPHLQAPSAQTSPHAQAGNFFSPSSGPFTAGQLSQEALESLQGTVDGKQHQTGFYRDATEAMSLSSNETLAGQVGAFSAFPGPRVEKDPPVVEQHRLPIRPLTPSLHADQYVVPRVSHPGQVVSGWGYDYARPIRPALPPQPQKQQSGSTVLIISISLVVALVGVIGITALFFRGSPQGVVTNESVSPTVALQPPTLAPTAIPTPQTTPTPMPILTPLPDPGFMWCGPNCTNYGFSVEYPFGWQLGGTPTNDGIQFTNPVQPDQTATFKAIGPTGGSASDLLNTELQINFMAKPGYLPPQGAGVTTLGGETWVATTVYYQSTSAYNPSAGQQRMHVAIYAIVYQSKGYIIEVQAPDPDGQQFTQVYNKYYAVMLSKFSFVQ